MLKYLFSLILLVSVFNSAYSQAKSDTLVYYVTKTDDIVASKDLADYTLVILPMKEENGKKIYPVIEYYPNGKRRLIASSGTNIFPLVMDGPYLRFFDNGKRQSFANWEKGKPVGDQIEYYPNGKIYAQKKHEKGEILLTECRDSLGNVITTSGNGMWIEFDESFEKITKQGSVKDGLRDGKWEQTYETITYKKGHIIDWVNKANPNYTSLFDQMSLDSLNLPGYKNLKDTLEKFITRNLNESTISKVIGTQIYVEFLRNTDGSLDNFKVYYSPSEKLTTELIRVVKLSSPWPSTYRSLENTGKPLIVPVYFPSKNTQVTTGKNISIDSSGFAMGKDLASIEKSPEFPGGLPALGSFLEKTIKYPNNEKRLNITGKVFTSFIVEKDGSVGELHILRTPSVGLAEETLRVLRLSPPWHPGVATGRPVRVQYTMPINFSLGDDENDYIKNPASEEITPGAATYINTPSGVVYTKAEVMPKFSSGVQQFSKFLTPNIKYPAADRENNVSGKVKLSFIVENDGSISNVETIKSPSKTLAEECIRLIKSSPPWIPGSEKGRLIRIQLNIIIEFKLEKNSANIIINNPY